MHLALTLAVFLLTLILIVLRPRNLNEAWAAALGGTLMLVLGLVSVHQAWQVTARGAETLAFLLALMLLSELLDKSGFFSWAAVHAARLARGKGVRLYRNVFLLGALTTALLSLDTTAIILTPIVLAFVQQLKIPAKPFLLACAFVANTGSLLLPVSNLTNLLFQSAFHFSFGAFALRMLLPQVLGVWLNYQIFRGLFRKDIPEGVATDTLPEPKSLVPDQPYFRAALGVLALTLVGYFAAALNHIAPFWVALAGCLVLLGAGLARKQVGPEIIREISWPLFPFVVGLFIVVQGMENLGLTHLLGRGLHAAGPSPLAQTLTAAFGAGVGSNIVNNIPMALLSISALQSAHSGAPALYGALVGCNLGPNLTVTGSLATMLVITSARKKGEDVGAIEFLRAGLWTTPLLLLIVALAVWATFLIVP